MRAAQFGRTATVALLLDRGADAGAKSNVGNTALMLAALGSQAETAAVLAFCGAQASDEERDVYPLLAALHGWRRLQIAAAFRPHGLARRALRSGRGAVARDPPVTAAAATSPE